jgi:chromosomal replication initiation ATPase DnaA
MQARAWLRDATVEEHPGGLRLLLGSRFLADWVRTNFDQQIRDAARTVGLTGLPAVEVRRG